MSRSDEMSFAKMNSTAIIVLTLWFPECNGLPLRLLRGAGFGFFLIYAGDTSACACETNWTSWLAANLAWGMKANRGNRHKIHTDGARNQSDLRSHKVKTGEKLWAIFLFFSYTFQNWQKKKKCYFENWK